MCKQLHRKVSIFSILPILVSSELPCPCEIPTPCLADAASNDSHRRCRVPMYDNLTQCPPETRDCRQSTQVLCEVTRHAEDGFCCWTECSSLAFLRKCGKEPRGFEFEKTGIRDGHECQDPLNVRERCCLRELRTMETLEPRSSRCPKEGHELVALFDTVDGNGNNPANSVISPYEAMSSLKWLHAQGYQFVADDFHKIDVNGNHQMSWYELQFFCGHTGQKIPADEIIEVTPSNMWTIVHNPLFFAALVSSLVLGEFLGVVQVIIQHALTACGSAWQAEEPMLLKVVWVFLSQIWPLMYICIMWLYYFTKIEWEVCDKDSHVQKQFALMGIIATITKLYITYLWWKRKCPLSPSKDLERRAFLQQVAFRTWGTCASYIFKSVMLCLALFTLGRAVFYGNIGADFAFRGLEKCEHEDPDLALAFRVNEEFFLWNVFNGSFLVLYSLLAFPIENKSYEKLPAEEFVFPHKLTNSDRSTKYSKELGSAAETERSKWKNFE